VEVPPLAAAVRNALAVSVVVLMPTTQPQYVAQSPSSPAQRCLPCTWNTIPRW